MPPDRHPRVTEAADPLPGLRASWPVALPDETRGYRPLDLHGTRPVAAADLGDGRTVVVVGRDGGGPMTALPCVVQGSGWRAASAGDGVARAVLARLESPGWPLPAGFSLRRYDERRLQPAEERQLGTDQSNISVVVGDQAIVKWRTAPDADGRRATRLRLHLRANGFTRTPALLASLTWTDDTGRPWVLADIDAFLPGATDGWDHGIALLLHSTLGHQTDTTFAASLGRLTAGLHSALLEPSDFVPRPTRTATAAELSAIRASGLQTLERARAIGAHDQHELEARAKRLGQAIAEVPEDGTTLGHIHGDLHLGQLVAWRDGLDVIDFDGPPEPTAPAGEWDAPARDVAQMLCSLWSLAEVVDDRTEGAHTDRLQAWARSAETAFLMAYRQGLSGAAAEAFDARLLEPFMAEQLCRELLYADSTLPRWRYAPLQALRWRYPPEEHDD